MTVGSRPLGGGECARDGSTDLNSFVTDRLAKHLFGVVGHDLLAVLLGNVWANECGSDSLPEFGGYFREGLMHGLRELGHPGGTTTQARRRTVGRKLGLKSKAERKRKRKGERCFAPWRAGDAAAWSGGSQQRKTGARSMRGRACGYTWGAALRRGATFTLQDKAPQAFRELARAVPVPHGTAFRYLRGKISD